MPDRTIPANAERYKGTPDIPRCGGIISHLKRDGTLCEGSIWWDLAEVRQLFVDHDYWTVQCWDPLTCNPSFLCHCGDHGFIRDGKWVRA